MNLAGSQMALKGALRAPGRTAIRIAVLTTAVASAWTVTAWLLPSTDSWTFSVAVPLMFNAWRWSALKLGAVT